MKTFLIFNTVLLLNLSAYLFMLVKTWFMMQYQRQFNGHYVVRDQDRPWLKPGWFCVLIFMFVIISFVAELVTGVTLIIKYYYL